MSPSGPRVIYQHQFKKRRVKRRPPAVPRFEQLTIPQILAWAEYYRLRTGRWPKAHSGRVAPMTALTWASVNVALVKGLRGLPQGSSLARLLADTRGVRNKGNLPRLTVPHILGWADSHHRRTGHWPHVKSGRIADAPGETWNGVNTALERGGRGLPGGDSLLRLLARRRGVRNLANLPPLRLARVLRWADAHHARTGRWPHGKDGPIAEAPGESWTGVDLALRIGIRGFAGGSSLSRVLIAHRGVRTWSNLPRLTPDVILAWADAHHAHTGKWPTQTTGPIPDAPGERWGTIANALRLGLRGLPGGSSLARLLSEARGVRNIGDLTRLTPEVVLAWADAHHERTGCWPDKRSGPIGDAPGETWKAIYSALHKGRRGLPGGTTLPRFLEEHDRI